MFNFSPRIRRVVAAIVHDRERQAFLVVFNRKWAAYTFPTRPFPNIQLLDAVQERAHCERIARQALRADLGPTLGEASEAHWMDRVEVTGVSGRTGRKTRYLYDVVTVVPVEPLPAGSFAARFGFLTAAEILGARPEHPGHLGRLLSFTTWEVLGQLLAEQEVAVAVVCRPAAKGREYLVTPNRYGQFFFPARRLGDGTPAERLLVYEFQLGANYLRHIDLGPAEPPVRLEQETRHLGKRGYTFHLHPVRFRDEDLSVPANGLEAALDRAGTPFRWVPEGELALPSTYLSDTVQGLAAAVLGMRPVKGKA